MEDKRFYTTLLTILAVGVVVTIALLVITSILFKNVSMITFIGKELN